MKSKLLYTGLGACLTLALVVTSVTFASQASDEITACISNANGSVRIINPLLNPAGCKKNETLVTWSKEGPVGPQGEAGPRGETGPQGEPGDSNWDEARIASLEARVAELEGAGGGGGMTVDAAAIRSNPNSPDATSLLVEDDTTESDQYTVHVFDVEVDEDSGDLSLGDAYVWVTLTNTESGVVTTMGDVVADVYLTIGGQARDGTPVGFGTANTELSHLVGPGESNRVGYRFDFGGLTLPKGARHEAAVSLVFEGIDGGSAYSPRVTVATDVLGAEWELEGSGGTNVLTGTDASETHRLVTSAPVISDVSASVDRNEAGNAGTISFEFAIEADANDIELSLADIEDTLVGPDTTIFSVPVLTRVSGDASFAGGVWTINDGDSATFSLDYTAAAVDSSDNGSYRVSLDTILDVEIDTVSPALNLVSF